MTSGNNPVALRISGAHLVAEEITLALGHKPTTSKRNRQGELTWILEATEAGFAGFDHQVIDLLDKLTKDLDIWRQLSKRFEVDLYCG